MGLRNSLTISASVDRSRLTNGAFVIGGDAVVRPTLTPADQHTGLQVGRRKTLRTADISCDTSGSSSSNNNNGTNHGSSTRLFVGSAHFRLWQSALCLRFGFGRARVHRPFRLDVNVKLARRQLPRCVVGSLGSASSFRLDGNDPALVALRADRHEPVAS
jgi:hypothetical protein